MADAGKYDQGNHQLLDLTKEDLEPVKEENDVESTVSSDRWYKGIAGMTASTLLAGAMLVFVGGWAKIKLLELSCKQGVGEACYAAGESRLKGVYGFFADRKNAAQMHEKACFLGVNNSCSKAIELMSAIGMRKEKASVEERVCRLGDSEACIAAGSFFNEKGESRHALEIWFLGCGYGNKEACVKASGLVAEIGWGEQKLITAMESGCGVGNALMCTDAGMAYLNGFGVAKDEQKAVSLLRRGCVELKNADACRMKGIMKRANDIELKMTAARLFEASCKTDRDLCGMAATAYELIAQAEKKKKKKEMMWKAVKNYRAGCKMGDGSQCRMGGDVYLKLGKRRAAKSLYIKGCHLGQADSCMKGADIAWVPGKRRGNMRLAASLWKEACEFGDFSGCFNLGVNYDMGRGVKVDKRKASKLYYVACREGKQASGCWNLSVMYRNGEWVEKNAKLASRYAEMACDYGSDQACNIIGR